MKTFSVVVNGQEQKVDAEDGLAALRQAVLTPVPAAYDLVGAIAHLAHPQDSAVSPLTVTVAEITS